MNTITLQAFEFLENSTPIPNANFEYVITFIEIINCPEDSNKKPQGNTNRHGPNQLNQ